VDLSMGFELQSRLSDCWHLFCDSGFENKQHMFMVCFPLFKLMYN
jgi:hypothetical protein